MTDEAVGQGNSKIMDKLLHISLFLVLLVSLLNKGHADRTNKKIYINIKGMSMCFRRMNATHQIGCNSNRGGNVGVLHHIQNEADIKWILNTGTHAPYIGVMTAQMFVAQHVRVLVQSGKVNGLMVAYGNGTDRPEQFSPDESCPNDRHGLYHGNEEYGGCSKTVWNPEGNGFLFEDFNIPIVALTNDTELEQIVDCFEKFNKPGADGQPRDFPLCSAQLKDEMDAAKDTPTCMRRSQLVQGLTTENYCDALGSLNVFALTRPITLKNPAEKDSIIVASARMDGSSLFDGIYPNADSAASGIVTLLAVVKAIGDVRHTLPANHKPIMFTFFDGESYDYIGSSRMIYDMQRNQFPTPQEEPPTVGDDVPAPISLDHIHSLLEISQIGRPLIPGQAWIQRDPLSPANVKSEVQNLVQMLQTEAAGAGLDIKPAGDDQPLPPASLQTFLKHKKMSGVVITDHQSAFTNTYYNSRFDMADALNADYPPGLNKSEKYDYVTEAAAHIHKVANTVAKTLYKLSTGLDPASVTVDNTTVANLLYCYMHDPSCDLFASINDPDLVLGSTPMTYYVGVSQTYGQVLHNRTAFTRSALVYYLGDVVANGTKDNCKTKEQPDKTYLYKWMAGPRLANGSYVAQCYKAYANTSIAKSPAFDIPDYDWSSNLYSSWTESQWQADAFDVRIFLVPSKQREIAILLGGLGLALLSLGVVYFIKSRARSLFTVAP